MGIEPPYIGLYGICSMVGIEVRGMGILECGMGWSVGLLEWVVGGSGYFESGLQHSSAPESCATQPRRTVSDDCSYSTPRTPWLSFGTISYASLSVITRMTRWRRKQPVNHPKNLSTKTRIFGCIYSGKFSTEVTASVMGSCHHPNMVTPQRVKPEMTVSKS
jgi:hypothetical protein